MKKILITLIFVLILSSCKTEEKDIRDDFIVGDKAISDYEINTYYLDIFLDEESDMLLVEGEIVYVNDKADFDELYITMYPNALYSFGNTYNIQLEYLRINGEEVGYSFTGSDSTQLLVDIDDTLNKGENFDIEFKYSFDYWHIDRLVDFGDEYYVTMFFYPFVSMYDDEGWNLDPYTFSGESYYNDIGDYYVSLNVREDFIVASSGDVLFEETNEGRKTEYLYLDKGRDFSFSASPHYFYYERNVDGRDYMIYSIRELSTNEEEESFNWLTQSFELYEREVGPYDYDYFRLEFGNIYGMESSGITYCSQELSEGTVVHEVIHQWFYSMIGNDQGDESFLDESLTTFITGVYYLEIYGQQGFDEYYGHRTSLSDRFADRYLSVLGESLLRKVDEFDGEYGYLIYYHGVSIFKYYVDEYLDGDYYLFLDILKEYYNEYYGETPSIDDFLTLLETESGVDITKEWFMMQISEVQDLSNTP